MTRPRAIERLYGLLDRLRARLGGPRRLESATGADGWPERGVYFFFEPGECRDDGESPRIVRVGTHDGGEGSASTLWDRLRQHRGSPGGGTHRASVVRLHVGTALLERDPGWDDELGALWVADSPTPEVRDREVELERAVSSHIGSMPLLWLPVDDVPGPGNDRGVIARNAVALLSNVGEADPVDLPSEEWLGRHARSLAVRWSGLWNVDHVEEDWDEGFLDVLEGHVEAM